MWRKEFIVSQGFHPRYMEMPASVKRWYKINQSSGVSLYASIVYPNT